MPNIKLKGQTGEVLTYEDVERVYFDSADEEGEYVYFTHGLATSKTVEPNFASGDMSVPIADGELVVDLTIEKPDTLKPENIRAGTNVAGVVGDLIGDTEEITVDLDMADGGQIITPSAATKVLSKVVVTKPGTMVPGNIRKGIDIGGVVGDFDGDTEERTVELNFLAGAVRTELLAEQTLPFENRQFTAEGTVFPFDVGDSCVVMWDGTEYAVTVEETTIEDDGDILTSLHIGNASLGGLDEDTGEPFLMFCYPPGMNGFETGMSGILASDDAETHTVAIYHLVKAELLPLTTYDGFAYNSDYGTYMATSAASYALTVGETYFVVWDGETYECIAQDGSTIVEGSVGIGNGSGFGLSGNNEPFGIVIANGYAGVYALTDTEAGGSHTVRIYQKIEAADMVVTPSEEGKSMSKVTIVKPETLIPENIRYGENVGGVEGTCVHVGTDPYIEYAYNEEGQIVAAKMFGFTEIPDGCFAFSSKLTSVDLSGSPGITSIGEQAFRGCSSLTEFDIPNTVTRIGQSAFYQCTSLESITIPDSATSIGSYIFYGCTALTNVSLGRVNSIPDYAFYQCTALESIEIPDSVTSIGTNAFNRCSALTSIEIPDSVTSIGTNVFYQCTSLESITIPDSVTSISNYVFQYCSALTSIEIPDSVTSIGTGAFTQCSALTSIEIPNSVTSIGTQAFLGCTNLTNVTLGSGLTSISTQAFANCTNLMNVTLGSGLTSIGDSAFSGCSALESITIPDSIKSIGKQAFNNTGLTSATFEDSTTWYIGASAGATTTKVTVTNVSTAATYLKSTYKSYYWTKV